MHFSTGFVRALQFQGTKPNQNMLKIIQMYKVSITIFTFRHSTLKSISWSSANQESCQFAKIQKEKKIHFQSGLGNGALVWFWPTI